EDPAHPDALRTPARCASLDRRSLSAKGRNAMPLQVLTIPCLSDNYAFVAHDPESGETAVIDVPEAAPILATLQDRGWRADHVLLTHHHADHVQGLDELLAAHPARVVGARADVHR